MCKVISFSFWSSVIASLFVYLGPLFDPFKVEASLPPANEVWGKVIFLHLFAILFTGGGQPGPGMWVPGPGGGSVPGGMAGLGGLLLGWGCLIPGGPVPRGCLVMGGSAPRGVSAPGGFLVETLRVVPILLECILV